MSEEKPIPTPGLFQRIFKDPAFRARASFLERVALFQGLGQRDLGHLIQSLLEKNYAEGELLFDEGDIGRALFIVEHGSVELFKRGMDGTTQTLASTGPGDFFGEMALLEELPRSAAAVARTDTTVYLLYRTRLFGLIQSRPRVGVLILDQLARLLSARLRATSLRLVTNEAELDSGVPVAHR